LSKTSRRFIVALAACLAPFALAASPALAAPTADFTVSANPQSGVPVTFTSTSTSPELFPIASYQWTINGVAATGATVQHTFAAAGTYTVSLTVTNGELIGGNTDTEEKTVAVATRPPTAAFIFNPSAPSIGDNVLFVSQATDPDGEALTHTWAFGDGSFASGTTTPSHEYKTPGQKSVRLTVNDGHGGVDEEVRTVTIRDPSAANASFTFSPENPVEGQQVTFTSTSTPSSSQSIKSQAWDLDSDGRYDDATGKTAARAFDSPGVYRVALRVVQANDVAAVAEGTVRVGGIPVSAPPGITSPGDSTPSPNTRTVGSMPLLSPFPVVRLVGQAYVKRTVVTLLSVRAPRGALARVRCQGKGCPKAVRRKRSKGSPLRFKTFERSLPAGARLEVFVVRAGRIGKFTRFKLRSSKIPVRTDLCVVPGKRKPRTCPR
jgi:PKD repeat protein